MRADPANCGFYPLRQISAERFRDFGISRMVYLKVGIFEGKKAFAIYAADGTPLAMVAALETALEQIGESGLSVVTVH